jgi:hypothetical protein
MTYKILIVYGYRDYPARSTSWNHLYAHGNYSGHDCYYLNLAVNRVPWYIKCIKFDLIIFDTLFFVRFKRGYFEGLMRRAAVLKKSNAIKVMLPQDEFINTDLLCRFAHEFKIDHIFSVAPESEWEKIYDTVDLSKTQIHKVLTGYLNDSISLPGNIARDIDIGYCAADPPYWHGRHGMLKGDIGKAFLNCPDTNDLRMEILTPKGHPFLGDDWLHFLMRCKYTLGVEGGTSILDRDGTIRTCTERYQQEHPEATFEEVEQRCFSGVDGSFKLFALSPRHLEACATRTCQILIEGDYDGVLQPWKHYLPLKKDFSNLDQIVEIVKNDALRTEITECAFQEIVASNNYAYPVFSAKIIETALGDEYYTCKTSKTVPSVIRRIATIGDRLSWQKVHLFCIVKRLVKRFIRISQ